MKTVKLGCKAIICQLTVGSQQSTIQYLNMSIPAVRDGYHEVTS
jgi:hypothetical protein